MLNKLPIINRSNFSVGNKSLFPLLMILFRSHSVELRFVGFGFFLRGAHDSILVMRRRIDRIEFQIIRFRSVDDIVLGASRYHHRNSVTEFMFVAVNYALPLPFLKTEKLIVSSCTSIPISSPGLRLISTNWLCFEV